MVSKHFNAELKQAIYADCYLIRLRVERENGEHLFVQIFRPFRVVRQVLKSFVASKLTE